MSAEEKYQWVKHPWMPPLNYKFPVVAEGKKNRSFQKTWFESYPWLVYSETLKGALCKVCIVHGRTEGGTNNVKLGKLVLEPLKVYKKAIETMNHHANTEYHKRNAVKSADFIRVMEGKSEDVVVSMQTKEKEKIKENRQKLIPIIKTIILCGTQNIPLRGHRDDGELNEDNKFGEGNFRALINYRIDGGDGVLGKHIESCGKNASYMSKTTQNELIVCCGEVVSQKIFDKVKKSHFFTIIADETSDVSLKEQLSICLRYFDVDNCEIREDFLKFVDVKETTGESISATLIDELNKFGLDILNCRGQAFDGGSNMSGKFKGTQARIIQIQPLAIYIHCCNHRLNLALSKACTLSCIRNTVGVISSIVNFFRDSMSRINALEDYLKENSLLKEGKHALKKMCETRWVERHDSVLTFLSTLPSLPAVLEKLAEMSNDGKAFSLLHSITNSEFIVSAVVLADVFSQTLPLAKKLQGENMDVLQAKDLVEATISSICEVRQNSEDNFKRLFKKCMDLASEMNCDIKKPRTTSAQKHRSNQVVNESIEDFYRVSIFIPFLDFVINELNERFPKNLVEQIGLLQKLVLIPITDGFEKDVLAGALFYKPDLPNYDALEGELKIWKHLRKNCTGQDQTQASTYKAAADLPNIKILLQIIYTLPITTSTAERSFSTLRRLKTYLRSTMNEERLNGLALLNIHQDISNKLEAEEVLEIFSRRHKRKMTLTYL